MKRILILITLFAWWGMSYPAGKFSITVSTPSLAKTGPSSYTVNTSIEYRVLSEDMFEGIPLLISTEDLVIDGPLVGNTLLERDFLFSGISVDLNNDGDVGDSYPARSTPEGLLLNKKPVEKILQGYQYEGMRIFRYYDSRKKPLITKIGDSGLPFIVYSSDTTRNRVTIGIDRKGPTIPLTEFPNPGLQMLIIKAVESPGGPVGYAVVGPKKYITYSNERLFSDQAGDWLAVSWAVLPVRISDTGKTDISFNIQNVAPPFAVVLAVNLSFEKGVRLQGSRSSTFVLK